VLSLKLQKRQSRNVRNKRRNRLGRETGKRRGREKE
jgi:hypothetical protein